MYLRNAAQKESECSAKDRKDDVDEEKNDWECG